MRIHLQFHYIFYLCLLISLNFAFADNEYTVEFDIPEGDASETVRVFGAQSDKSIIYNRYDIEGITTHAISGEFRPSEALRMMFLNTPLGFDHDLESDAFAIIRLEETSPKLSPIQTSGNSDESKNVNPNHNSSMNNNTEERGLVKLLAGLLTAITTVAPAIFGSSGRR